MNERERLIELFRNAFAAWGDGVKGCKREEFFADFIANGVTVQEWIPVKDRLPEDDPNIKRHLEGENFGFLTVLVYNGVVKQTTRFFCTESRLGLPKTNGWAWGSSNVTHWMPLPEPPKGE